MTAVTRTPPPPRRTSRRGFLLASATLPIVILGGTVASGGGAGRDRDTATTVSGVTEVAIHGNYFDSASIEVPAGTTVTWRWEGDANHNVVGDGVGSPIQDAGEFSHTFDEPGSYPYESTLHDGMTGEIIVTASS
ncbi:MAG: hypothetical protein M3464_13655 [Chloroflexota bacterium]|nr:hypothetical protein [Chloroflexota bacterium]